MMLLLSPFTCLFHAIFRPVQRAIDLAFLWPACRAQTPSITRAKAAFAWHCYRDDAWIALGADEIARRIARLT